MKNLLLASVLLISLMLIAIPTGYTGNPPPPLPPGEQYGNLVGPDIHGTVTFVEISSCNDPSTPSGVSITFDGWCKGKRNIPVYYTFFFSLDFFSCVSPEWLLGTCSPVPCGCNGLPQQLTIPIPDDCSPPTPHGKIIGYNEYPVVTDVHNFYFDGYTVKTANIIAKWLTIVPTKPTK